jgi:dipeptidyl aminopeptidase/acylaminoacyl peptidase
MMSIEHRPGRIAMHARVVAVLLLAGPLGGAPRAQAPATPPGQAAGPAKRLTFEDVLRWRLPSSLAVSPDGKRVAFVLAENDLEKSRVFTRLWWVDADTRQTRRLTNLEETVAAPAWSPDGRWLGFITGRTVDGIAKPQVWLLPADGGEAFALTSAPEGVLHWRWSPDSQSVFYAANAPSALAALREQEQKQKKDAVVVDEERPRREIWRVSVENREASRIFPGDRGLLDFTPSPDGKWLVYRSNLTGDPDHETRVNLWLFNLGTRQATALVERAGEESSVVWSPDSTRIAFLAPREAALRYSQPEVFLMPVAWPGARPEPQRLTRDFTGTIEALHWPRGNTLYFAAAVRTANQLFLADVADGVVRPASPPAHYLAEPAWNPDGTVCAALLESATALPEIAVLRPAAAQVEPQKLTDLNPQLRTFALGAQEVVRWKSKDGREVEGVLIRPAGADPARKHPLLLDIHGGPYGRRANTLTTGNLPQAWAARGWLVLQPNFRGSSGYGHEFGLASRGDIGGGDYQDILAGVDFVIAQGWADPERMAVMGESYGGYMTSWIIGQSERFRAAVSAFGIFSLLTDFSNSAYPSWEADYLGKFYWENLPLYLDRSPMKNVAAIRTPVLILHGDDDDNTFISNSKEMYQALRQLGRTVRFVRFPREGHGFVEPQHVLARFRETAAWLEAHVPGFAASGRPAGETVRSGPWELRVAAVRAPQNYAGLAPKNRFVELELLIRAVEPVSERYSLLLFNNDGSDVTVSAAGRAFHPEGVVAESQGQRILIRSTGQVAAIAPEKDGSMPALAVALAFDLPADARELILRVKDYPALKVELPVP